MNPRPPDNNFTSDGLEGGETNTSRPTGLAVQRFGCGTQIHAATATLPM